MKRNFLYTTALIIVTAGAGHAGKDADTFTWASSNEMGSADIYYGNLREALINTYAMCDSLIHRNPETSEYQPLLATSWTWIDDVTLDLELRQGVTFHDGSAFDAKDVAYTLNHIASPDSGMVIRVLADWIDSVEVVSPDKVRIHAKSPTPAALEYLTGTMPIFPSGHYDNAPVVTGADGTTRTDYGAVLPMCTGPYRLTEFQPGETLTLERNPDYFADSPKGQPQIGRLVFRTIKDPETQLAELVTGGVDWIWSVPTENKEMLAEMPQIKVVSAATIRMSFLSLDAAGRGGETPLTDVRVRQAIAHAIDRDAIVANLVGDGAAVLKSMCAPVQTGCDPEVAQYAYDPDKARALLAEAGYSDGVTIPFLAYRDRPYSEAVMNYLREVGISTDLRFLQWGALKSEVDAGSAVLAHLTWGSNGILDASASMSRYFLGDSNDYARDAEVTGWVGEAGAITDPERRAELYSKALNRIAEQVYDVPLFLYGRTYAFNAEFEYLITEDELAHFYLGRWK